MCETVATSETVSDGSGRPRYVACEVARDVKWDLTRTGRGRPLGSPAGGVPIGMTTDLADLAGCLWQRTDNCTRKGEHGSRVDTGCDLAWPHGMRNASRRNSGAWRRERAAKPAVTYDAVKERTAI